MFEVMPGSLADLTINEHEAHLRIIARTHLQERLRAEALLQLPLVKITEHVQTSSIIRIGDRSPMLHEHGSDSSPFRVLLPQPREHDGQGHDGISERVMNHLVPLLPIDPTMQPTMPPAMGP